MEGRRQSPCHPSSQRRRQRQHYNSVPSGLPVITVLWDLKQVSIFPLTPKGLFQWLLGPSVPHFPGHSESQSVLAMVSSNFISYHPVPCSLADPSALPCPLYPVPSLLNTPQIGILLVCQGALLLFVSKTLKIPFIHTLAVRYLLCMCVHMPQCAGGGHRTTCGNQFSLSTTWNQGTELRGYAWQQAPLPALPPHMLTLL